MQAQQPLPVLYSFRRCPYAMRARLALMASGRVCELREVVLRNKPDALLHASPKGTVPVLVLPDGPVLAESLDIMLWALRLHDPDRWLAAEAGGLAAQLALILATEQGFKPQLDRYKYPNRFGLDTGLLARKAGADWLQDLERCLQANAYLFGSRPALADWAIAPFVRQYAHTDKDWFNDQAWPGLRRWLGAFLQSGLLAACMEKYPAWTPGDAPLRFGLAAD